MMECERHSGDLGTSIRRLARSPFVLSSTIDSFDADSGDPAVGLTPLI
jgi:hypothetical protein